MLKYVMALSLVASPALAEERLVFAAPEGFGAPLESALEGVTTKSYLPEGETLADWTRLITATISPDAALMPAGRVLEIMAARLADACPGAAVQQGPVGIQNGFDTAVFITQCPRSELGEDRAETAVVKVLSGVDALYTLRYAWRFDAPPSDVQEFVLWTRTQILCDTDSAATPCPTE